MERTAALEAVAHKGHAPRNFWGERDGVGCFHCSLRMNYEGLIHRFGITYGEKRWHALRRYIAYFIRIEYQQY